MKLSAKVIATAAFVVFLLSAFKLSAIESAEPAAGDDGAAVSSDPNSGGPAAPMPMASMAAAMPYTDGLNNGIPKAELFLGYSYLRAVPTYADGNRLVWLNGGSTSVAYNLNRHLGLVGDFGAHTNSEIRFKGAYSATVDVKDSNVAVLSFLAGPRLSFRKHDRVTPFVQALFGGVHANQVTLTNCTLNCTLLPSENSFAMTAGGGLDIRVRRHFAIRVIQAEYLMTRFTSYTTGKTSIQNDMRLSSGIVFRFGGRGARPLPAQLPLELSCSVNPSTVYTGEPIAVSGTALNLDPAKTAAYTWSADGGMVTGTSSTASIDTKGVSAGAYTLKGHVSEGEKPNENAECAAHYIVKAFEPPTVSCSASPVTVVSGDPSTITTIGSSPQNRPLTYAYHSDSGVITGSGTTAVLSTSGVATGTVTVTCNLADDKGQTASATTSVAVTPPAVAPKPLTSDLCSIHFDRDRSRPVRVDNEAKACLDEVALSLQRNSDAKLALIGNSSSKEKAGKKLATERAANTKAYLVGEKGIDSSRIVVYTGSQDGKIVSTTLIPAGATLDAAGHTPVD